MRKTIYVKDQELWDSIRVKAGACGVSMSEYLMSGVGFVQKPGVPGTRVEERLDRIEGKLDRLLEGAIQVTYTGMSRIEDGVVVTDGETPKESIDSPKEVDQHEQIRKANERLKAKRKEAGVDVDKIGGVSLGYSKDRQLGKRGE